MFKFNFGAENNDGPQQGPSSVAHDEAEAHQAKEIPMSHSSKLRNFQMMEVGSGVSLLKCNLSSQEAASVLEDVACSTSDLVPGKYEGGFKVWEGALDLTLYLAQHESELQDHLQLPGKGGTANAGVLSFAGLHVLELGCGHGLPGILALGKGASVDFQDYNTEVLTEITGPNILANWEAWQLRNSLGSRGNDESPPARLFSGDWASLSQLLVESGQQRSYDLVLTAETIYSLANVPSLLSCMKTALRSGGLALVAAKVYYFGVGGSTQAFRAVVERDASFAVKTLAVEGGPASIQREIIVLTKL